MEKELYKVCMKPPYHLRTTIQIEDNFHEVIHKELEEWIRRKA